MKKYMLTGVLAVAMCTEAPMAQASSFEVESGPSPVASATGENPGNADTVVENNVPEVLPPLPAVDNNLIENDGPRTDPLDNGNSTDSTESDEPDGGINITPSDTDDDPYHTGDPRDLPDNNTEAVPDDDPLAPMLPDPQPRVEIDNEPPIDAETIVISHLPFTITQAGQYSVLPKAVYEFLWQGSDLPSANAAMIVLDPYRDSVSSRGGASITIDFNGTVISDCLERCSELVLFTTKGSPLPVTNGENITIRNLTINRGDIDIYNPGYRVDYETPQYLTLVNVNRGGENLEVLKSDSVYQTTLLGSTISEKGSVSSIDQYRGCLTASDSHFDNKEVVITDVTTLRKCSYHRLIRTTVTNSIFRDKLDRPFKVTNGYIDNSEFKDIIVDMNTSHDFHIGTDDTLMPISSNESVCTNRCGIIDENGDLHWGFTGNEALWKANKRTE
ncbi:hypothetical protein [Thiolapillus sp.]